MSYAMALLSGSLASLWGRTLLQFVWQGVACAAACRIALLLSRRASPERRYTLCCITLLVMMACLAVTFVHVAPEAGIFLFTRSTFRLDTPATPVSANSEASSPAVPSRAPVFAPHRPAVRTISSRAFRALTVPLPLIAALWLAGAIVQSARLLMSWAALARLVRRSARPVAGEWEERLVSLCRAMGLRRKVRLRQADAIQVPAAIGSLHAIVLMPAAAFTDLSADQLETLVAHELAHVRRWDSVVNLCQLAAETLLFFHPAVWWVSCQIRMEREYCCDAAVLRAMPDQLVYARALTSLEAMRTTRMPLALAGDGGSLMTRIRYIVGLPVDRGRLTLQSAALAISLSLGALGLAWGLRTAADPATPTSANELMKQVRDYYQSLHDFSMVIEHKDSSGLMPGRYTQTLRWRNDNRFELITTDYKEHPDHKADFYADGTKVTGRAADGRVAEENLHGEENLSYGWEVSGGPILVWLQHTVNGKFWFSGAVRWSYGPRKLWRGHKVRELCLHWDAKSGVPTMNYHMSYFLDVQKPLLIGMETDAYHKPEPSYDEYRNQTVNNGFSDKLGQMPIQLQSSGDRTK